MADAPTLLHPAPPQLVHACRTSRARPCPIGTATTASARRPAGYPSRPVTAGPCSRLRLHWSWHGITATKARSLIIRVAPSLRRDYQTPAPQQAFPGAGRAFQRCDTLSQKRPPEPPAGVAGVFALLDTLSPLCYGRSCPEASMTSEAVVYGWITHASEHWRARCETPS
jgi:hypothetical protein